MAWGAKLGWRGIPNLSANGVRIKPIGLMVCLFDVTRAVIEQRAPMIALAAFYCYRLWIQTMLITTGATKAQMTRNAGKIFAEPCSVNER